MLYCKYCGSELKGAKKFCLACGKSQEKSKKDIVTKSPETIVTYSKRKQEIPSEGLCIKCENETDKRCYFCKDFVCREHYIRMQANINPYINMQQYITENDTKRINEGWRGGIIIACPKCTRLKVGKELTAEENIAINVFDECTWYKLDSQH